MIIKLLTVHAHRHHNIHTQNHDRIQNQTKRAFFEVGYFIFIGTLTHSHFKNLPYLPALSMEIKLEYTIRQLPIYPIIKLLPS